MSLLEILFMYGILGVATAAGDRQVRGRWSLLAVLLWPLVLPGLFTAPGERFVTTTRHPRVAVPALDRLRSALTLWDPTATPDLDGLEKGLHALQERRRALEGVLARPENDLGALEAVTPSEAAAAAHAGRLANLERLKALEAEAVAKHDAAVARIEELATRVQVAHYKGVALPGLERQLSEVLAVVAGACEVDALG
jgi:hypothetical protein